MYSVLIIKMPQEWMSLLFIFILKWISNNTENIKKWNKNILH